MEKASFEKELPLLLQQLTPEAEAKWGIMTPQHMVEHLIVTWKISRGRIKTEVIDESALEKNKKFLMSDLPYPKNIGIPAMKGQLQPLRLPDLETAKETLLKELNAFHEFFEDNPDAMPVNPVFGSLNKEEWEQLHFKHTSHHLTQFGVL